MEGLQYGSVLEAGSKAQGSQGGSIVAEIGARGRVEVDQGQRGGVDQQDLGRRGVHGRGRQRFAHGHSSLPGLRRWRQSETKRRSVRALRVARRLPKGTEGANCWRQRRRARRTPDMVRRVRS